MHASGRHVGEDMRINGITAALASTVCIMALATPAQAQERQFNIPAGSLKSVLDAYGRQAGRPIIYKADEVRGVRSKGYRGASTAQAALDAILANTGFSARADGSGAVAVVRNAANASPSLGGESPNIDDAAAGTVASTEDDEAIVVVGTRIPDVSPTSPVITVDREDIERRGDSSVEDVFAKLPQNLASRTPATAQATGANAFASEIDLRGLGPEATLVLVNGRRVSAAAADEGRALDVSLIPISAVSRIDILTDGASALYGSDAIGGVVNIVLRDDFDGAESTVQYGLNANDADELLLSQVVGKTWNSGNILLSVQYTHDAALKSRELGITSSDFTGRGGGNFGLDFFASPGTVFPLGPTFSTVTGPGGAPVFFAALPQGDGRSLSTSDLRLNDFNSSGILFEDISPEQKSISGYATIEQDIGAVTAFADFAIARRESHYVGTENLTVFFVPASNAFTPFDEDVLVFSRLADLGSFRRDVETNGWFANLGLKGGLWNDWKWEVVGSASRDKSVTTASGFNFNPTELATRLASSDPAFAFNPFGDGTGQSAGVVDALLDESTRRARTTTESLTAQAQGSVATLPGGALRLAIGGEQRHETLVTGSNGDGDIQADPRDITALFGELYAPLASGIPGLEELALSAAVRYEHYSDFGDTVNPKLGIIWRPFESLSLKANWGTSFRAPSLRELGLTEFFSPGIQVFDPNAPGGPASVSVDIIDGGNPNLQEETAETYTLSVEYRPLPGARLTASYYHTDYKDRIRGAFDGLDFTTLLQFEEFVPSGIIVRDAGGNLVQIKNININSARTIISGFDLAADYSWSAASLGEFNVDASATIYDKFSDRIIDGAPALDLAGRVGSVPDWRGRFGVNWSMGGWAASAAVNYIDNLRNEGTDPRIVRRDVDGQTTVDAQLSYEFGDSAPPALRGVTMRLGADNLFDEPAPFVDNLFGIDPSTALVRGRTVYFRVTKRFGGTG